MVINKYYTIARCHICRHEEDVVDFLAYLRSPVDHRIICDRKDGILVVFCDDCYGKIKTHLRTINLTDGYVISNLMIRFNISRDTIKEHPELIKAYKEQIRVKRLLKFKKHENSKTS